MTILDYPECLALGAHRWIGSNINTLVIDAAGEKAAMGFEWPADGAVAGIFFRLQTVTAAQDLKVSFQDPTAATFILTPDGVVDQYRVVPSASLASLTTIYTGLMTSNGTDGGTKRTAVKGQKVAVVFEFDSAVGNISIQAHTFSLRPQLSRTSLFTGAWADSGRAPLLIVVYADGSVYPILDVSPFVNGSSGSAALISAANPNEVGNIWIPQFAATVWGVWATPIAIQLTAGAGRSYSANLYDTDGTTVLATSGDRDPNEENASAATGNVIQIPFTAGASVQAGGAYRLTFRALGANACPTVNRYSVPTATETPAMTGGASLLATVRQAPAGAWTAFTNARYFMGPVVSEIDIPTPGGGMPIIGGSIVRGA